MREFAVIDLSRVTISLEAVLIVPRDGVCEKDAIAIASASIVAIDPTVVASSLVTARMIIRIMDLLISVCFCLPLAVFDLLSSNPQPWLSLMQRGQEVMHPGEEYGQRASKV